MHIWFLGGEDSLEEGMAIHSSIFVWREEPGKLQSMGSQRVGQNWSDLAHIVPWYLLSFLEIGGKVVIRAALLSVELCEFDMGMTWLLVMGETQFVWQSEDEIARSRRDGHDSLICLWHCAVRLIALQEKASFEPEWA